jgi:hypothetical protein
VIHRREPGNPHTLLLRARGRGSTLSRRLPVDASYGWANRAGACHVLRSKFEVGNGATGEVVVVRGRSRWFAIRCAGISSSSCASSRVAVRRSSRRRHAPRARPETLLSKWGRDAGNLLCPFLALIRAPRRCGKWQNESGPGGHLLKGDSGSRGTDESGSMRPSCGVETPRGF